MKSAYAIFFALTLLLVNVAYAHEVDTSSLNLEDLVKTYNNNLDKAPDFAKKLFGNERLDIYIDDEIFAGFVVQNSTITDYKAGGVEKPTIRILTTSETIGHLLNNETTLLDAIQDKSITYQGVGFFNKIKFGFIKIFQGFFL